MKYGILNLDVRRDNNLLTSKSLWKRMMQRECKRMKREEYPYLYETHLHTKEASACAAASAEEMVQAAKEAGYSGIFITNHNWYGNTCIDRSLPWEEWISRFYEAYKKAKHYGDKIGLDVFFGYESGYHGTEFLIYGVDAKWLMTHPEIKDATVEEQYLLIHQAGGLVIHAHPYREASYISEIRLFPEAVDGIEGANATHACHLSKHHYNPEYDVRARNYARKYDFPITGGSDVHNTLMLGGGVAFRTKLTSELDYVERIKAGTDYVVTDGDDWYDSYGKGIV